ncbi:hypothetical protein LPJGGPFB_04234 [Ensifer adhaerens]|nr:hypothetical protein [Ensifer adhaerens]NRP20975.1 hypothetical protein [Ensifer adhaerens]
MPFVIAFSGMASETSPTITARLTVRSHPTLYVGRARMESS